MTEAKSVAISTRFFRMPILVRRVNLLTRWRTTDGSLAYTLSFIAFTCTQASAVHTVTGCATPIRWWISNSLLRNTESSASEFVSTCLSYSRELLKAGILTSLAGVFAKASARLFACSAKVCI
jgi:hypothetical protein